MSSIDETILRVAVLDMYENTPNKGMPAISALLESYSDISFDVFDVRGKKEMPGLDYDAYISSGGPGNPLEGDGVWDRAWYSLMSRLWKHNQQEVNKKSVFFICHSFQMISQHLSLGAIVKRNSKSEGIFPVYLTDSGLIDPLFENLDSPVYVADFREYQFIQPDYHRIEELGCSILAIEKERKHVHLERAVMAIRFSEYWEGTQFHPEADAKTLTKILSDPNKRATVLEKKGERKFDKMNTFIVDPQKLQRCYDSILPNFINRAISTKNKCKPVPHNR